MTPPRATSRRLSSQRIVTRLRRVHGAVKPPRQLDPLGELIFTILSQSTADTNSRPAFDALQARFAGWDDLRAASVRSIAAAIRPAGLANQKAPRIKRLVRRLHAERGRVSLDHLTAMTDADAVEYLTSFEGVGPKTAACVLLFACRRQVLPVDTHVHRVSTRLGLIPPRTTAAAAHELLGRLVAPRHVLDFHVLLVRHGRTICQARRPRCGACPLWDDCPAGPQLVAAGKAIPPEDIESTRPIKSQQSDQARGSSTPHVPRRTAMRRPTRR